MNTVYEFSVKDRKGKDVSLKEYANEVLLIVNTATKCGFTPQYEELEQLYEKYHSQGFEILDFPCNQFLGQAPGTEEEIVAFCKGRFGVTFKQFAKINVNGKNEIPLYTYLKEQQGGKMGSRIKWNFTKFLVDREGNVVNRFAPTDKPEDIEKFVEQLL